MSAPGAAEFRLFHESQLGETRDERESESRH
jgi:hypothetical protein